MVRTSWISNLAQKDSFQASIVDVGAPISNVLFFMEKNKYLSPDLFRSIGAFTFGWKKISILYPISYSLWMDI